MEFSQKILNIFYNHLNQKLKFPVKITINNLENRGLYKFEQILRIDLDDGLIIDAFRDNDHREIPLAYITAMSSDYNNNLIEVYQAWYWNYK